MKTLQIIINIDSCGTFYRRHCALTSVMVLQQYERKKGYTRRFTWGVQVLRPPNFFLGMEADRNLKVVAGDVAVLYVGCGQVATLYYPLNACDEVELQ